MNGGSILLPPTITYFVHKTSEPTDPNQDIDFQKDEILVMWISRGRQVWAGEAHTKRVASVPLSMRSCHGCTQR